MIPGAKTKSIHKHETAAGYLSNHEVRSDEYILLYVIMQSSESP